MKLKTDSLLVSAYVRHGDMCSLNPHCDTLGCASGHKSDDYVLVARFSYLQEGLDYCHEGARRGCRMILVSRIAKPALHWQYVPEGMADGTQVKYPVRVIKRDCGQTRGSDHYCLEVRS